MFLDDFYIYFLHKFWLIFENSLVAIYLFCFGEGLHCLRQKKITIQKFMIIAISCTLANSPNIWQVRRSLNLSGFCLFQLVLTNSIIHNHDYFHYCIQLSLTSFIVHYFSQLSLTSFIVHYFSQISLTSFIVHYCIQISLTSFIVHYCSQISLTSFSVHYFSQI